MAIPVKSLPDNFDFALFGAGTKTPFRGYISSIDPTIVGAGVLIGGSQNVYKRISEDVFVRPGLLRRGTPDATLAGVTASFDWETSFGALRPLRVVKDTSTGLAKLQVESDIANGTTLVWYDLMENSPTSRFVFDTYWNATNQRDQCVFVKGDNTVYWWNGGIGKLAGVTANTITLAESALSDGFFAPNGVIVINGNPYTYTGLGVSGNVVYTQTPTNNKIASSTTQWSSQKFTTGASSTAITSATAVVNNTVISGQTAIFVAGIYTDNAGVPGTLLGSATASIAGTFSPGDFILNFVFSGIASTPATNYHLVIHQQTTIANLTVYTGNTGSVGTNLSTDSGVTWSPQNGYLNATVTENTVSNATFVGVAPNPSGEALGSVVLDFVYSAPTTPDANFTNDFLKTVNNQLHVGSYNSEVIYVSSNTSFVNFTVPTVRAPGDPDELVLGSLARGITIQKGSTDKSGNAVISGGIGDWYTVIRTPVTVGSTLTEQVNIEQTITADLTTALAHEFIDLIGDSIVFLDQNNQLRQFGLVRNIVSPVLPLLSLDVFTELKNRDFTGGALRVVEDEGDTTVYITAPNEGIDYMYQIREQLTAVGNVQTERLWQPPMVRGISRIAVLNGVTYGYSATNPQIYQLWNTGQYYDDGPFDGEELPYRCGMIFAYLNLGRTIQMNFDKLYFEGHMTRGSIVYCNTYLEYQGSKNILNTVVNKPVMPNKKLAQFFGAISCPVPGQNSLGTIEVGDGILPRQTGDVPVPKFRAMRRIASTDVFEAAFEVYSEDVDAEWGLLLVGVNMQTSPRQPTGIMA